MAVLKLNEVPPHPLVACNMQVFVYNYSLQAGVQNPGAIVRGAAHRLGRDSDYQPEISRMKAALEADALLMKLEAELLS